MKPLVIKSHTKTVIILFIALVLSAAIYNSPEVNIKFEPLEFIKANNNTCSKKS